MPKAAIMGKPILLNNAKGPGIMPMPNIGGSLGISTKPAMIILRYKIRAVKWSFHPICIYTFTTHNAPRLRRAKRVRQHAVVGATHLIFCVFYTLDNCHVTVYNVLMIKTFADKETQKLFVSGKSKRLPSDLLRRAIRRLEFIHFANDINDLLVPPSNRLHALKGDRKGQHSISINDQWRICFRFIEGDAYDVEITDYH